MQNKYVLISFPVVGPAFDEGVIECFFDAISLGETTGERGKFCRGKGEFDTGKLELRGRQKQFGRSSQHLRSVAQISSVGRANPFFVFYYL